jgi:uncharacterized protein
MGQGALSAIFFYVRRTDNLVARKRLLEIQREWLAFRNTCGADNACLNQVYDQRLHDLREIDIPVE